MMRRAQPWLGTMVEVSAAAPAGHAAIDKAFAAVARVHRLMSFHDSASDVSRINHAAPGDTILVDACTWQVLELAGRVADLSAGAFDPACAPRLVQWSILPAQPGEAPRLRPMRHVLALEPGAIVRKLAPGWIDLGGIAKGYAVDQAVEALRDAGIDSGCVNAGGDLRVFGSEPMRVAVRSPLMPALAAAWLTLRGEAIATSASYFSSRTRDGQPVSALLDARDGRAITGACSASVRAPRCVLADALTKVVLATGDAAHPALAALGAQAFLI